MILVCSLDKQPSAFRLDGCYWLDQEIAIFKPL